MFSPIKLCAKQTIVVFLSTQPEEIRHACLNLAISLNWGTRVVPSSGIQNPSIQFQISFGLESLSKVTLLNKCKKISEALLNSCLILVLSIYNDRMCLSAWSMSVYSEIRCVHFPSSVSVCRLCVVEHLPCSTSNGVVLPSMWNGDQWIRSSGIRLVLPNFHSDRSNTESHFYPVWTHGPPLVEYSGCGLIPSTHQQIQTPHLGRRKLICNAWLGSKLVEHVKVRQVCPVHWVGT